MIQILVLKNDLVLISRVEEVSTELGEPDCKLIKPFKSSSTRVTSIRLLTNHGQSSQNRTNS